MVNESKYSFEEAFALMEKYVPLQTRLRNVYVPIMLEEICFMLAGAIRGCLVENARMKAEKYAPNVKDKQLKRDLRTLKELMEQRERDLSHDIEDPRVLKVVKDDAMELYGELVKLIGQSRQSFKQAIWHEGCRWDENTVELVALCYVVRMMLRYAIEDDIRTERQMNEYLKECNLRFEKTAPDRLAELNNCMIAITTTYYGLPRDVSSPVIDTCRRVLDNSINALDFARYAVDSVDDLVEA